MKVLELFGGSCSFSNVAKARGHTIFTSDMKPFDGIDYVTDILDFDVSKVPFRPDIIWASPPCTYFSVASIGHHWNKDHTPKTPQAKHGVKIIKKTIEIIEMFQPDFYFIENPRGKLRKLGLFNGFAERCTITYCQYGDTRMKPTDIWTNILHNVFNQNGWIPRPMCKNGDSCHESAPRGSRTGTQGLKNNYEKSKIPFELCNEIIEITEKLTLNK
tara:strand:+ start:1750 stop:2397 length:648 start_codon:yes stop_codon:yes gene_type:complete